MPNRVIKDSIKRSSEIGSLTWFQEVCFYRLMVTVDDNGCYLGNPQILKSDLFPLVEDLTKKAVAEALDQLEASGLIERYEVDGKEYLHMKTWEKHQRIRNKTNHYPLPPQLAANCGESRRVVASCGEPPRDAANRGDSRPESKNPRILESKKTEKSAHARETTPPPTPFISDEEAIAIQSDQNMVLDALKAGGFPDNEASRAKYLDLLAEVGKERMLEAIDQCVEHSVSKLDYLKAVLKGPKKPPKAARAEEEPLKIVPLTREDFGEDDNVRFI